VDTCQCLYICDLYVPFTGLGRLNFVTKYKLIVEVKMMSGVIGQDQLLRKMNRTFAVSIILVMILSSVPSTAALDFGSNSGDVQLTPNDRKAQEKSSPPIHIHLKVATFDPLISEPSIDKELTYDKAMDYYLVQCTGPIKFEWVQKLHNLGAKILGYVPDYTYLVHMDPNVKNKLQSFPFIRWLGTYHPAYKLTQNIFESAGDLELSIVVFSDSDENPHLVREMLLGMGGEITHYEENDNILRVRLSADRITEIARIPQVEWLEEYTYPVALMNNIRVFTGAETLHGQGYNGSGIVGEVKDNGIDQSHPDFEGQLIGTDGNPTEGAHGTACFGIVFSSGANNQNAEGMMPGGEGVFCDWGVGRKQSITNLVNIWGGVFQSNSWHISGQTDGTYNSNSRANDEAVFDNDVTMLYAAGNSNDGVYSSSISTDAAAKNIITVGAVTHYNDQDRTNDMWVNWGAGGTPSQGPASDGRIKPDLAGVFDSIFTTDSTVYTYDTGQNGYSHDSDYYGGFGGTSGATPIVAGASGLVYQMYGDDFFGNNPQGEIPHAATVKAILIADAYQYEFAQADRFQQGWGGVDVGRVYDIAKNHFIVNEEVNLQTGEFVNYSIAPRSSGPMKISLVWTDVPGTTSSSQHLINDLNLKVTDPQGTVYWGNIGLETSKWSSSGGSADTLNNVENVFIENPTPGNWTVEIIAENIAMDGNIGTVEFDQHFALVASNVLQDARELGVSNLGVSTYVAPGVQIPVSAEVINNGLSDEVDITVNLTIDDVIWDSTEIPLLGSGNSTQVSFDWTPQTGIFMVGVEVEILPDEDITLNNIIKKTVIAEPDVSVSALEVPRYSRPNTQVTVNTTITNLGKVDLSDVQVEMRINGTLEDTKTISALAAETSSDISFSWTPIADGIYGIEINVPPHADEELDGNNRLNSSILITSKDPVLVVIVDSWGTDNPDEAPWDHINDNWVEFGATPVIIDYTSLDKTDFTYDDIVQTGADVLLISSSYAREFSDSEIDAISNYVLSGFGFVATGVSFYQNVPNNNKMAYIFGMRDDITYDAGMTSSLDILDPGHPILKNIPNPHSPGNPWSSVPADGSWSVGDVGDGTYIAISQDDVSAIIAHKGVAYISHWLEYQSTNDDMQLLYNAMIWSKYERELHDISVTDINVPRYIKPETQIDVYANVMNLGLSDETGISVSFYVDGNLEDQSTVSSLASDSSSQVHFVWNAQTTEDIHTLRIESNALSGETVLDNNHAETEVIVSNGPKLGTIGLISDASQLQIITSTLDDLNRTYDILDNNVQNDYTKNILLLLQYQMVIFYNENRVIDTEEHRTLNDYIELGGSLVVTGFDSLGAPDDALMADLVRSTETGDNMGKSSFTVTDDLHPIMNGVFGQFSKGSSFSLGETDHDYAESDVSRGASTVAELPDGYDKIISTELSSGGKVIYWNGNTDCDDWQQADIEDMFKNLIVWLVPIFDDVGIVSHEIPSFGFVDESQVFSVTVMNYGLNDSLNLNILLEVTDFIGMDVVHSELKTGISLVSTQSMEIFWQWTPTMSYVYYIDITLIITKDEIPQNNMVTDQIDIFYKFFEDDMENGVGGWDAAASSFTPLWHLTNTESNSPSSSWWCGMDSSSQYTVLGEQYLTSPVIDLADAASAYLWFYHKFAIDDNPLGGDWGEVEINPQGTGWITLDSYDTLVSGWSEVSIDLTDYIGDSIEIRFHLSAGVILSDNGWWVDDVVVFGIKNQWGVEVSTDLDTDSVSKDEYAQYEIRVENTGNLMSDFQMNLSGVGTEDWDVEFLPQSFSLFMGFVQNVTLTIMPNGSVAGVYPFTVVSEIWYEGELKAQDTIDFSLTVNPWFEVDMDTDFNLLNLIPGEKSSFEIEVTNLGNDHDTFSFSLDIESFGTSQSWGVQFSHSNIDLNPFESQNVTLLITAPFAGESGDYLVVNVTGSSAGNPSETAMLATTSVIIDLHILDLSTPQTQKKTISATPINYYLFVNNMGNTQVSVDMELEALGNWGGWTGTFEDDSFSLDPFTERNITLTITPPSNILENSQKEFLVKAITSHNTSIISITSIIERSGDIEIGVIEDELSARMGDEVLYYITVTNTQNANDTVDIRASSLSGWDVTIYQWDGESELEDSDGDGKPDTGLLEPWDDWEEIVIGVIIPQDTEADSEDRITVTFSSSLPNSTKKTASLIAKAEPSGLIVLDALSYSESAFPGLQITYWITVKNHLNFDAVIDISVNSMKNWGLDLLYGDGVSDLGDTNQNGIPDTGSLEALGGTSDIMVVLNIPQDSLAFTKDLVTVTGSSSEYENGATSVTFNATVSRIYDFTMEQDDTELLVKPGKELEFSIKISNFGNYDDDLDLSLKELPFGWRGYLSDKEPVVPMDGWKVITVTLDIPSDSKAGDYLVYITATSADGEESRDLTVSVEVQEDEDDLGLPLILLLLMLVVIIILVLIMVSRRKTKKASAPRVVARYPTKTVSRYPAQYQNPDPGSYPLQVSAYSEPEFEGPIFPTFETIRCPACYSPFEVEAGRRPQRVQCPKCGVAGTLK
jgi:uncharacterized membrane protein